jgi:hypothetical protein
MLVKSYRLIISQNNFMKFINPVLSLITFSILREGGRDKYLSYSYLKASTGFIFDAFIAGRTPDIAPVNVANAIHPTNNQGEK